MNRRIIFSLVAALAIGACSDQQEPSTDTSAPGSEFAKGSGTIGINVLLKAPTTAAHRAELAKYGNLMDEIPELNVIRVKAKASQLSAIQALPFVEAANPDAERHAIPIDPVEAEDFADGISTWDQDAVNVTDFGNGRTAAFTGEGVYVGILDTGLLPTWRQYFPQERIAEEYAKTFGGGGGENGNVSEPPNKWESDVNSHGTHVTSTVLGYEMATGPRTVNGTAPKAIVIPVKVLNQNGSGWSSAIARGIMHITELKRTVLANDPVVINMSLGGSVLDAVEKAAIDEAVEAGVIIVASAGNSGPSGRMGFPGAYGPVISVASVGYTRQWETSAWWRDEISNTSDPTNPAQYYVSPFSALRTGTQDLDVAAPGSLVVGPYQINQSKKGISFFFLNGTSMSAPHVTGIVALMLDKNPTLGVANAGRAARAENILETTAIPLPYNPETAKARPAFGAAPQAVPSWNENRSGKGLATADAALAATP